MALRQEELRSEVAWVQPAWTAKSIGAVVGIVGIVVVVVAKCLPSDEFSHLLNNFYIGVIFLIFVSSFFIIVVAVGSEGGGVIGKLVLGGSFDEVGDKLAAALEGRAYESVPRTRIWGTRAALSGARI